MQLDVTQRRLLESLKTELQQEGKDKEFEAFVAASIGRLLQVPILVARSGFQFGADAGPGGREERRFRIECKKYGDNTSLNDRSLLGEVVQALQADPNLEAWVLAATRDVPEQLANSLLRLGETSGLPIEILDWSEHEVGSLAAICAFAPDLVADIFSVAAGAMASDLRPVAGSAIASLQRRLQAWCLGFDTLRRQSHEKVRKIWGSRPECEVALFQNAAGGAEATLIKRVAVQAALDAWWRQSSEKLSPAAVIGRDGVGKTWAALGWLSDTLEEHPIVLVIPSQAVAPSAATSVTEFKHLLAARLREASGVRDVSYWLVRLERLMKRPIAEGPALTLFLDGLNQEPGVAWLHILKILQGDLFAERVRVVLTARTLFFEDTLMKLRNLAGPGTRIDIGPYSLEDGGELDQMLAHLGLPRAELHPDLIELAATPRLFRLVVRLREKLVDAGQITPYRLLWEYGRDSFGERDGRAFSEADWLEWLKEVAQKHRKGVREYSRKELTETTARADLTSHQIAQRLSEIVDGRFTQATASGSQQLTPVIVAHALGAGLLAQLDRIGPATFNELEIQVSSWLDPIAALDERSEILRAAVSIVVERGGSENPFVSSVLVDAWLQSQNAPQSHRLELVALAPHLTLALMDTIEHVRGDFSQPAGRWALTALRGIPRTDATAVACILERAIRWVSQIALDLDGRPESAEQEARKLERLRQWVGFDAPGTRTLLGASFDVVSGREGPLPATLPTIIEGIPIVALIPLLERVAVIRAVVRRSSAWDGLSWLCFTNEVDPQDMPLKLRERAETLLQCTPEPGLHRELPLRVAKMLLDLSGHRADELRAEAIETSFDRHMSYEKDYLPNPGRSFYPLERRHARAVLEDNSITMRARIGRAQELCLDPTFELPESFVLELRGIAQGIDVEKLHRGRSQTVEDNQFEAIEPWLARAAPDLLADLTRRKLRSAVSAVGESRVASAYHAAGGWILAGPAEAAAARILRHARTEPPEDEETYAACHLLLLEIKDLDAVQQFDALIAASLEVILKNFEAILRQPTLEQADSLVRQYGEATLEEQRSLLVLLSVNPFSYGETTWSWIERFALIPGSEHRALAFRTLGRADAARFGDALIRTAWTWSVSEELWVNHYGSIALIEATRSRPFEQIAPRVAPWRLLEAARVRGAASAEVRMAAERFGQFLLGWGVEEPDPGSDLSIQRSEAKAHPFLYSSSPREADEQSAEAFMAKFDTKKVAATHMQAAKTAQSRIAATREAGGNLYLVEMEAKDFELVIDHACECIDAWLEGSAEQTSAFRRRVLLAEPAYLCLCEALLNSAPARGALLWRSLRRIVTTQYLGAGDVDDMLHMIFRSSDSAPVLALRQEQLALRANRTDAEIFDLALAAVHNGHAAWMEKAISEDCRSPLVWRQMRGIVLSGFMGTKTLPMDDAWPSAPLRTTYDVREYEAARYRSADACARHWWRAYINATSSEKAYAAWVLFLRAADRRAFSWMESEAGSSEWASSAQCAHARLNVSVLKSHAKKRLRAMRDKLLGGTIVRGISPWT